MRGYRDYMDRQQVSADLHDRLLKLEQQQNAPKKNSGFRWQRVAALAASLCLVVGLGWFGLQMLEGMGGMSANETAADCAVPEAAQEEAETDNASAEYAADDAMTEEAASTEGAPMEEPGEAPAADMPADYAGQDEPAAEEAASIEDEFGSGFLSYSPEGYTFEGTEEYEDTQILRWKSETGDRITVQRIFAFNETLRGGLSDQGYPIYLAESEDWKRDDAAQSGEMGWGFVLDWGDMLEVYTSTEGPEGLWVVVEDLQSYEW
ncbi:MAG: hypothetical protein IJX71_02445 [Oscillospiraceae bacterium]|nr:hypothetical protein [Oscillospiraceae bacterium]